MGRAGGESEDLGGSQERTSTPSPPPRSSAPRLPGHPKAVLSRAAAVRLGRGGGAGTLRAGRPRRTSPWDSLAGRPWKAPSRRGGGRWVPLCVVSTRLCPPAPRQTLAEARPPSAHGNSTSPSELGESPSQLSGPPEEAFLPALRTPPPPTDIPSGCSLLPCPALTWLPITWTRRFYSLPGSPRD